MKNIVKLAILFLAISGCSKPAGNSNITYSFGGGVFIVDEGNFRSGNGSLSFYSYDSSKIFNDVFSSANNRPLGDVPNSMAIKGDQAYIMVNNSGKIEVINQTTLKSIATITGLISPRNISFVNDFKAYVSSLYSDSVAIINLTTNSISGYINIRRTSEAIAVTGSNAYISNWTGGHEIMVISTLSDKVTDSIVVGKEPESMAFDRTGILWVLCNGGWDRQTFAELDQISTATNTVVKTLVFPTKEASPTCLKVDGTGQTLYYLDNGVRQVDFAATEIPSTTFIIQQPGENFYKIGINPINSDVFITDAVDFVQQGYLLLYDRTGKFVIKLRAGIIPGSMCFKLIINS
jgi:DNA-binding beta-propeller fold protein YncE